jgi:hypothetical protein
MCEACAEWCQQLHWLIDAMKEYDNIFRKLQALDENYQAQQIEIENIWRRILNDFPVAPYDD